MAQGSFSAAVDAWVLKTKQRQEAVFKTATQNVVEDVIGRTPRDTGYLQGSLTVTLNGPVPMTGKQGDGYAAPDYTLGIAGAKIGDVITASFAAVYARRIEYGFVGQDSLGRTYNQTGAGMVRLAAQAWPSHVAAAVSAAKARVAGS